jgi:hypothetical protein
MAPQWNWTNHGRPTGVNLVEPAGRITVMDPSTSAQRPYVFMRGSDGRIWARWLDGAQWKWTDHDKPPVAIRDHFGATTVQDNPASAQRPHVAVQGSDRHLWLRSWNGSAWSWVDQGQPTPTVTVKSPAGLRTVIDPATSAQRLYAFAVGSDDKLWRNSWDGAQWKWVDHGDPPGTAAITAPRGGATVRDTLQTPERIYVFVQGSDGKLWVNWWDGAQWNWTNQGKPPSAAIGGPTGTIRLLDPLVNTERPYTFVRGSDGNLWINWWSGSQWSWANQGKPAGGIAGSVGARPVRDTSTSVQRPHVFVRGTDGHLWLDAWNGAKWNWADQGSPSAAVTVSGPAGVLTVKDNPNAAERPHAFVQGSDGNLWVNWWG